MRLWFLCVLPAALVGCGTPAPPRQVVPVAPLAVTPAPDRSTAKRRIAYDGAGNFILPDGSIVQGDGSGGFNLPNGTYVAPDGAGGVVLPNGARCISDGGGGYLCP